MQTQTYRVQRFFGVIEKIYFNILVFGICTHASLSLGYILNAVVSVEYKGKSCYTFHTTGMSWTANRDACKKTGGDLISIETQDEWSYISSELRMSSVKSNAGWHVGLEQYNGQWVWINGKSFDVGHWGSQEPSGDGPYTMMDSKGKLFDIAEKDNNGFICEKPLGKMH